MTILLTHVALSTQIQTIPAEMYQIHAVISKEFFDISGKLWRE